MKEVCAYFRVMLMFTSTMKKTHLTRPAKRKNVLDVIKELGNPTLQKPAVIKDKYYQERKKKYGF